MRTTLGPVTITIDLAPPSARSSAQTLWLVALGCAVAAATYVACVHWVGW